MWADYLGPPGDSCLTNKLIFGPKTFGAESPYGAGVVGLCLHSTTTLAAENEFTSDSATYPPALHLKYEGVEYSQQSPL